MPSLCPRLVPMLPEMNVKELTAVGVGITRLGLQDVVGVALVDAFESQVGRCCRCGSAMQPRTGASAGPWTLDMARQTCTVRPVHLPASSTLLHSVMSKGEEVGKGATTGP